MNNDKQFTPKKVAEIKPDRQLNMVRFSPGGRLLAGACHDGTIRRWDAGNAKFPELPPLTGHNGWATSVVFHPDGKRLFSADSWGALHCRLFADKDAGPVWANDKAHDGWLRGVALSPDGRLLATCGADRAVRLFSAEDGNSVTEFVGHADDVFSVAFHPDGKSLVSGDLKGVIKQWNIAGGRPTRSFDASALHKLDRLQDTGGARRLVFDGDGTVLVAGGALSPTGGFVKAAPGLLTFDWVTGKRVHLLKIGTDDEGYTQDLQFHPAGFLMAVTSGQPGNGKLVFVRPEDPAPFFSAPSANSHSLAFNSDGARLAVSATGGGNFGNGRQLDKDKKYPGSWSPIIIWELPDKV